MSTPRFKKKPKSNLVLKNQLKLEEFDVRTFGKDYPHWSQSSTFLPNAPSSSRSISETISAFNSRKATQSCYDLERLAYKPQAPKRFIQLENESYNPIHYWNDWFGRPGNGAPLQNAYKQNLSYLLEPKRSRFHDYETFRDMYGDSYEFKRFGSNHHNHYELDPQ